MKQITRVRSNVSQHITLPLNKYCLLLLLLWANPPPSPQSPDRAFGRPQSASSMYTKPPRSHDPLYTCSIVEVIVGGNVCSTPLSQRLSGQAKVKEEGLFYFVSTWQRLSGFCQSNFHVFHTPRASIILSLHSIPAASSVGKTPNWNYEYFEHNRRGSAKLSSAGTCTIGAEISHASHDSPQLWWEHGAEGALC